MRVKSHWFRSDRPRPPDVVASVLAAIVWRAAVEGVGKLRKAHYDIEAGPAYVAALIEFLVYLTVVADRLAYRHDPGSWREAFTVALAKRVAAIVEDNLNDLIGPAEGGHGRAFLARLDDQADVYAEFDYLTDGPSFGLLRHFGQRIADAMAGEDDRRWAQDQVMSVQGPETAALIERAMGGALGLTAKPRRGAAMPE